VLSYLPSSLGVDFSKNKHDVCEICSRAKQTCGKNFCELEQNLVCFCTHPIDIQGSYRVPSSNGAHYFLIIVNDSSQAT